jgi:hypothetical protein
MPNMMSAAMKLAGWRMMILKFFFSRNRGASLTLMPDRF